VRSTSSGACREAAHIDQGVMASGEKACRLSQCEVKRLAPFGHAEPVTVRRRSTSEVILTRRSGPSSSFIDCSVLPGSLERGSMKQKE
jgi:hypothetical protein